MGTVGEYIFSVAATALICGVVNTLLAGSSAGKLVKTVSGLVMFLCVVQPVSQRVWERDISLPDMPIWQWEDMPISGTGTYQSALGDIIKQKTESYILDKASEMGLSVTVNVSVSEEDVPVPESVVIIGSVSPYGKLQLEGLIDQELNISKENQFWTG